MPAILLLALSGSNSPWRPCAALHGHLETCQFIMQKINDINPRGWFLQDIYRRTPLYFAAENGHLAICKLIMEHINTNPRHTSVEDEYKQVTFQIAAEHGHLEVCQWIIEIIDDKNPPNINGTTPLHFAAEIGHLAICKLILEHIVAIKILEMIIMIPQPMAACHFIWLQRTVILMFAHQFCPSFTLMTRILEMEKVGHQCMPLQ